MAMSGHLATTTFLFAASLATAQSGCVDQSFLPPSLTNGLEVTANQPVTQTFTCGRTGQLSFVEVSRIRHHNGLSTNPLTISLVTTSGGVPTTTVLASTVVQPAAIPTSIQPLLLDFSAANVQVQTGQVLGLALTSPNAQGTPSYAWWGEAPGGSYAGGQIFIQQTLSLPVWDLAFQTWVSEPATWSVYGAGFPGALGVPTLAATAAPVLGTTPDVLFGSSTSSPAAAVLFLGVALANVPTPFGGAALVQPATSLGLLLPPTGAAVPFPVPASSVFCGFEVFAQGIVLDGAATAGLAFTAGLALVVGD